MAALSDADRAAICAQWQRDNTIACGITKADLRAAFNAADDWADANANEYNSALPQPARSTLTAKQKAHLLMAVIAKRHDVT